MAVERGVDFRDVETAQLPHQIGGQIFRGQSSGGDRGHERATEVRARAERAERVAFLSGVQFRIKCENGRGRLRFIKRRQSAQRRAAQGHVAEQLPQRCGQRGIARGEERLERGGARGDGRLGVEQLHAQGRGRARAAEHERELLG